MIGSKEETTPKSRKPRNQTSNKLTLSKKAQEIGDKWVKQAGEHFNGMVTLKRNDLINIILESLNEKLSSDILERVQNEKLTGKAKAKWIYKQMLEAEKTGADIDFNDLVKTAQGSKKRKTKPRKTQNEAPGSETVNNTNSDQNLVKKPNNPR